MRRHFDNGHNELDYAYVGDYLIQTTIIYSGRAKVPRIDSLRVVHNCEVFH